MYRKPIRLKEEWKTTLRIYSDFLFPSSASARLIWKGLNIFSKRKFYLFSPLCELWMLSEFSFWESKRIESNWISRSVCCLWEMANALAKFATLNGSCLIKSVSGKESESGVKLNNLLSFFLFLLSVRYLFARQVPLVEWLAWQFLTLTYLLTFFAFVAHQTPISSKRIKSFFSFSLLLLLANVMMVTKTNDNTMTTHR